MVSIFMAVAVAAGAVCGAYYGLDWGWLGCAFAAIGGFVAFQAAFGFIIQKRVKRDMEGVQNILAAGQKRLQQKMQRWQMRPPGSIQAAQKEIFEDTRVFVKEAIQQVDVLEKYRLWVPMIRRQMATAKLQLNWMIKEFKVVDKLLPQAILIDPNSVAMKMARMYMLDAPSDEIEKVYNKGVRRTRYNGNVLLAATWSWILVRRNEIDRAFKALTEALKKSDDATLKRNHELLMNNRVAHFSNSQIGDQWYALFLEEPKVHAQRPRQAYR